MTAPRYPRECPPSATRRAPLPLLIVCIVALLAPALAGCELLDAAGQNSSCVEHSDEFTQVVAQEGEGLGERLAHWFERAHAEASTVVVLGSDCPLLPARVVSAAHARLAAGADAVLDLIRDDSKVAEIVSVDNLEP